MAAWVDGLVPRDDFVIIETYFFALSFPFCSLSILPVVALSVCEVKFVYSALLLLLSPFCAAPHTE